MARRVPVKPVQPNQSIVWGITCLIELTSFGRPVTCKEMSERLGVERTKASRLLGTLAYLGMAERLPDLSYIPGSGLHVLSAMGLRGSGLLKHALPHIERLQETWNVTAALGVLWRDQVCYLYHGHRSRMVGEAIAGHELYPVMKSSIGQVILAQKDEDEVRAILGESVPPGEIARFCASLAGIRRRGYVLHGNDRLTMAIGTPATAGLAVWGKLDPDKTDGLVADVRKSVEAISENMGRCRNHEQ